MGQSLKWDAMGKNEKSSCEPGMKLQLYFA